MNKLHKIAALAVALIISSTLFLGCDSAKIEEQKASNISAVKVGCDKTLAKETGDISVYQMLKVEKEIDGVVKNVSEETYAKYVKTENGTDFSLTKYIYDIIDEEPVATEVHTVEKIGDQIIELKNGVGDFVDSAPDIFEEIYINFDSTEVASTALEDLGKGVNRYTFVMTDDYANSFDRGENGDSVDCTKVVFTYDVDVMSVLSKITKEYTYTLTYGGETQEMVIFVDIKTE